jgi:DNA-binding helix-hairpin-helix protein with protein kinase domain
MDVFDETGAGWRLGEQVASGGEGSVFRLPDRPAWCVKLYHKRPLSPERRAKLAALRALPTAVRRCAAVPLSLVSAGARSRDWIGVLLPFVEGHDIYELYNPQGRRLHFQHATFEFVVTAALNLAHAFEAVHAHGIIVGDISEQNIRVRADATLTLIDCDGFQINDGARCFPSNIGTPIWTPPELQGVSLEGAVRTRNHDGFGLAQLIFLLLFGGRYPFAGRPLSGEALSPEEAIAKFAFAFDPAPARPLLEPPPGAPRLDALPRRFAELFLRAFRRGSEAPNARPSPKEWGGALGELRAGLVRCAAWEAHVHWKDASHCAWCGVLEGAGVDLFPGPPVARGGSGAVLAATSPEALAQRLLTLNFEPIHLAAPSGLAMQEALGESEASDPAWWVPLSKGLGPLAGLLLGGYQRSLAGELDAASREVSAFTQKAAALYLGYASGLRALGQRIQQLGRELTAAASGAEQAVERYALQHRNEALKRYLEAFLLRRYQIQGVSPGRMAALLSHNIITAADVSAEAVKAVPGFSERLAERLLRWRLECERGFRYTAPRFVPEAVRAEAVKEAHLVAVKLLQQGLACEAQWNRAKGEYAREHGTLQAQYQEACKQRARLEARLRSLQ